MKHCVSPYSVLYSPGQNKGTSFTETERTALHLRGLVPPCHPQALDVKISLALQQLRQKSTPFEKFLFLQTIQDADETLFYGILVAHTDETMPLVYTPTVGEACLEWSRIYRRPRGVYISLGDRGHIKEILGNYINKEIKAIVLTDGERILGLGDLGCNGMGIPIGKLALYTVCAGVHPKYCLPVMIDVGTNTKSLLEDDAYVGLRQPRERGPLYDELIAEFFEACHEVYGRTVLLQFEDFGNVNAFRLLEEYRDKSTCFNDDIQGTASVILAGVYSSLGLCKKQNLSDHIFLFFGAGEAGIGIAELISLAISQDTGCTIEEARKRSWFVDSKGLISSARVVGGKEIESHKRPYAHSLSLVGRPDGTEGPINLLDCVKMIRPTALIGVSAQGRTFTEPVIKEMTNHSQHPLIMALSNPTSKAECTAEQAYLWSNGKCVFSCGSPFDPVTLPDGRRFVPGQGNNAYIFPGVALGIIVSKATKVTDQDFLVAAKTLASLVPPDRLAVGAVYPDLSQIREVSKYIAATVAECVHKTGRSEGNTKEIKIDWLKRCEDEMYHPSYVSTHNFATPKL